MIADRRLIPKSRQPRFDDRFASARLRRTRADRTVIVRSGVWVTAVGRLEDQELADRITELARDVFEALPSRVVDFHSYRT